jgi:hypothetical protein
VGDIEIFLGSKSLNIFVALAEAVQIWTEPDAPSDTSSRAKVQILFENLTFDDLSALAAYLRHL